MLGLRMVKLHHIIIGAVFAVGATGVSMASNPAEIRAQMSSGGYEAAHIAAQDLGTVDGYALAAECLLSEVMLGLAEKNKKQSKAARKLAEQALALDPSDQNARLQYTIADGFVTRETGDVSAWMKKLPQKTLAIVQQYRTDYPDDPRGDALLGAWHLAIVRKAGDGNARKWFGANVAEGQVLYEAALAKNASDPVVGVNYAFALLALDDEDMPTTDTARMWLERMDALAPTDHLNQTIQGYGRTALSLLDDRDAVRNFSGAFLDGEVPTVE